MTSRELCAFDMRVDDLDDQGRLFLYFLLDGLMGRATAQQAARGSATGEPPEKSAEQVVQVVLVPLLQRLLATIKVVQLSAVAGQVVPARAGAAQLGLARSRPLEGQALRSVVLSMRRSYACGVESE
jgi:hypothetical protein